MKFAIITDGNNKLGMGHVYQTMTLVEHLLKHDSHNFEIRLITKSDDTVTTLLNQTGCAVTSCADDVEILKLLITEKPARIIFDKLDVSPDLARSIKRQLTAKLVIFTNLTEANDYADVTVLADIGSNFKNIYRKDQTTGKVEFFGPKYWLLRPEFYTSQPDKRDFCGLIKKIMLIFGGSDPSNLSSVVLNELLNMTMTFQISLVLGASFFHTDELETVMSNHRSSSNVDIYRNISNVAEMMSEHDVIFASPGLSFFEALAVGTPVVGFHQNELQKETYKDILPTIDKESIFNLSSIIRNKSFIFPGSPQIRRMAIGKGKQQIIQEIVSPI